MKKRDLQKKYNSREQQLKQDFKKRTGKKIARGFNNSPEFKRNERNRKSALKRAENKLYKEAEKSDGFTNVRDISDGGQSFYNVLSYSSRSDKLAAAQFDLMKTVGIKFKATLDFTSIGLGVTTHTDELSFNRKMKWLYSRINKMQKDKKMGSAGVQVSAVTGNYGGTSHLVIKSE